MRRKGFTLVEIMVVVTIIAILAAIAVSLSLRARHNANEVAAIAGCKAISTGCQNFFAAQSPPSFPETLADLLPEGDSPGYIDPVLAGGNKNNYTFTYEAGEADERGAISSFSLTATPDLPGSLGTRVFFVDETGVIREDDAEGEPVQ